MLVTPGYQLPNDNTTALTRTNLNLLGIPTITLQAGDVTDSIIAGPITGSKITNIPSTSLDTNTQGKLSGLKNYIPNPQFNLWPAGTSFSVSASTLTNLAYGWWCNIPVTANISQQSVTPGSSDSVLFSAKFWLQIQTTSTNSSTGLVYAIVPNARLYSGRTINISLASQLLTGTLPSIQFFITQNFGTGGSPSSPVQTLGTLVAQPTNSVATSTASINVPSVASKTFGTKGDDSLLIGIYFPNFNNTFTLNITDVQDELGNTYTSFEDTLARWTGYDAPTDLSIMNGRLTLTSGTPILSSNVSTASTLYWTPYLGNRMTVWNGTTWVTVPFLETSLNVSSGTATTVYYVYAYLSNGLIALDYNTTAPTLMDGVMVMTGNKFYRYLGNIYFLTTGNLIYYPLGASNNTFNGISFCNYYNEIPVDMSILCNDAASWTYAVQTMRFPNANSNWELRVVSAKPKTCAATYKTQVSGSTASAYVGIGNNSISTFDSSCELGTYGSQGDGVVLISTASPQLTAGFQNITAIELCQNTSTSTFTGYNSSISGGSPSLMPITSFRVRHVY